MLDSLLADAKSRMQKSVEATAHQFATVRTGRASAALLDRIHVEYYGTRTPLNQIANISVPEARMLVIQPYDKNAFKDIERAILESDLGLNPSNDGKIIRLPIPTLTEDRRKELVKVVKHLAEEGRVAIRNIRRDVNTHAKEVEKKGEISFDDLHRVEERVQKLTDEHIAQVEQLLKHKEEEILEV